MKNRILIITAIILVIVPVCLFTQSIMYNADTLRKYGLNEIIPATDNQWQLIETSNNIIQINTPVFQVDTIIKSMMGKTEKLKFQFQYAAKPQLAWITGYKVEVRDKSDNEVDISGTYLCHNNLDYNPDALYKHWNLPDMIDVLSGRIVTLGPGYNSIEFPNGFGMPIMTNQQIKIAAQPLNLNDKNIDKQLIQKSFLNYSLHNKDSKLKPLFGASAYINRPIKGNDFDEVKYKDCRPAINANKLSHATNGNVTSHWVIEPGEEVTRMNVTDLLNLPFNTTVHYIASHLHPYADYMSLYDITDSILIFKAVATNYKEKSGIKKLQHFSSETGIMMYRSHQYVLECKTNNTTTDNQDMMAVLYLYLYDKELDRRIKEQN
ncbi:MAG: hypothetical protein HRT72_07140 [Flavobacteriales bacterium]|nr:hypothetical protein [Flavobacteriales bacterium]